jgi:hypothetical protein
VSINKDVTIQGAGADQTFIDAGGSGPVLSISASVNLLGLTIQNGLSSSGGTFIQSGTTVTIESCVIRNNRLDGSFGGGFHGGGGVVLSAGGTLMISNSTISGNSAGGSFGGGTVLAGGILDSLGIATTLKNTIVADNQGGDCSGTITSQGYNLASDGTCTLTASTDLPNTDPCSAPSRTTAGPRSPTRCSPTAQPSMLAATAPRHRLTSAA